MCVCSNISNARESSGVNQSLVHLLWRQKCFKQMLLKDAYGTSHCHPACANTGVLKGTKQGRWSTSISLIVLWTEYFTSGSPLWDAVSGNSFTFQKDNWRTWNMWRSFVLYREKSNSFQPPKLQFHFFIIHISQENKQVNNQTSVQYWK